MLGSDHKGLTGLGIIWKDSAHLQNQQEELGYVLAYCLSGYAYCAIVEIIKLLLNPRGL